MFVLDLVGHLSAAILIGAAALEPCALVTREAALTEPPPAGCLSQLCATPVPGVTACRCLQADPAGGDVAAGFTLTIGAKSANWRIPEYGPVPDQMTLMEVGVGDVTGHGRREIVIADRVAVSNGVPITSWTVTVVEAAPPFRRYGPVALLEYGPGSLAKRIDGPRGCDLLVIDLVGRCHADDGTVTGELMSAGWYLITPQGAVPRADRPPLPNRFVPIEALPEDYGTPTAWFGGAGSDHCP